MPWFEPSLFWENSDRHACKNGIVNVINILNTDYYWLLGPVTPSHDNNNNLI